VRHRAALDRSTLQIAVSLPLLALLAHVLLSGGLANPGVGILLLLVSALLAGVTLVLAAGPRGLPEWWLATATCVGAGLLPVLLVEGLAAPVDSFSPLFVLVLVVGAFTYPVRGRTPLFAWTLGAWAVALWWGGVGAVDLVLLHVGAGALIAYTVSRTADALGRALEGQAASREDAERRADLLARILDVHTLDPGDVLQAVLDGVEDAGFAAVSVRVPEGDDLVLAAGMGLRGELASRVPAEAPWPGLALRSGRVEVVDDRERLDALGVEPEAAEAIAVPIGADGRVTAVVTAMTVDGPIRPQQREAIELLSSLAGRALHRARVYAADQRTVAELRRLEARTQDFVSTVSHELRTPLTVVQGLGRTLRTRWDDLDPERRDDLVRRVDANAGRLAQMVRSLLDTSAFEEGRIALERQAVGLDALVAGVLHRLAGVTAAHPVHVDLPPRLRVHADPSLLAHVLENLLTNTAKHTPPGTGITIAAREAGPDCVEVVVADDGPGIPAADLPHVLDRFYRGGDPVSRPAGGLGLGLALANQILEEHASELRIDSEEGRGARFSFVLSRPSLRPEQT
jgi:signal transduction histidine kinase